MTKSSTNRPAKAVLRNSTWFAGLSDQVIGAIADLSVTRRYETGEIVFNRDEPGNYLYGVMSGHVRVTTQSLDGRELALNTLGPGDIGGEIAFLDGGRRTATGTAIEPTTVFVVPREEFMTLMLEQPIIAQHLINLLCERVRWTSQRVEQVAFLSIEERLALQLSNLQKHMPANERAIKISQSELATFLNVSRQVVNGYLQDWQKKGWVALRRGSVEIRDLSELIGPAS